MIFSGVVGGDDGGSADSVEAALHRLDRQRNDLEELWESRKVRLEAGLQLSHFERDVGDVTFFIKNFLN